MTAGEIGGRAGKTKCTETEEFSENLTSRYWLPVSPRALSAAGGQRHGGPPGEATGEAGPWSRPGGGVTRGKSTASFMMTLAAD